MQVKVLVLCVLVLLISSCTAALTEADFKRMKVKELREFLGARGVGCPGCQEKEDLVRAAFQNRDKAPAAGMEKRQVPDTNFWVTWSATTKKQCEEAVTKRGQDPSAEPYSAVCATLELAVDSYMMQHGKAVARKLKKKPELLLKTSYRDVYYDAGIVIIQKLIDHCLASPSAQFKCESLGSVVNMMENNEVADYKGWITNVGIENTNPMYEILGETGDL